MNALDQFLGARIVSIGTVDGEALAFTLVLPDGSERTLAVYHPFHEDIAVRIDGMFVPAEEL
jgi:hypothetical protein